MNKRGQETRKHIKKCACSLFAEKGFKQVTMKDICDAAKLSRGGLYCHVFIHVKYLSNIAITAAFH